MLPAPDTFLIYGAPPMRVTRVDVRHSSRPASKDPIRDALQTLTGGGSVEVEVTTDDGLVGRASTSFGRLDGAPKTLATLIETELVPKLIGRDPFFVGQIVEDLKRETEYQGTFGLTTFGISALDVALWDLVGKASKLPCYRLWGAYRDRLPAYAMVGWLNYDVDTLRRKCTDAIEHGFTAVKMKVGEPTLEEDLKRVEAVRREVGSDVAIMTDANQSLTVAEALRRGQALSEWKVYWFEEPIAAHDLDGYVELTARLSVPVATGENLYGRDQFAQFLSRRACRFIQPDLRRAGGPTEIRAIAALASSFGVPYASHGGGPEALSLLMCAPSAVWLETGIPTGPNARPIIEHGMALAPTGPGFGW
jgi:L-alanine-DL-glutamate epimerase-like enolase superfamily enzyme